MWAPSNNERAFVRPTTTSLRRHCAGASGKFRVFGRLRAAQLDHPRGHDHPLPVGGGLHFKEGDSGVGPRRVGIVSVVYYVDASRRLVGIATMGSARKAGQAATQFRWVHRGKVQRPPRKLHCRAPLRGRRRPAGPFRPVNVPSGRGICRVPVAPIRLPQPFWPNSARQPCRYRVLFGPRQPAMGSRYSVWQPAPFPGFQPWPARYLKAPHSFQMDRADRR